MDHIKGYNPISNILNVSYKTYYFFTIYLISLNFIIGCTGNLHFSKIDESAPASEAPLTPAPISNQIIVNVQTPNAANYPLTGTCPAGATSISFGSPINGSATCLDGSYTTTTDLSNIADGTYTITSNFDIGASPLTWQLIIDRVPPVILLTSPSAGSTASVTDSNVTNLPISGTCSSDAGNIIITVADIQITADCASNYYSATLNLSTLVNGNYSVQISQTDSANNSATISFQIIKNTSGGTQITLDQPSGPSGVETFVGTNGYKMTAVAGEPLVGNNKISATGYQILNLSFGGN